MEILAEEALSTFYRPAIALSESTICALRHSISRYARRFFYSLARKGSFNKAFLLAIDIGAKDLFNDLYYCSLDAHENQLAEICRRKYHQLTELASSIKQDSKLNQFILSDSEIVDGSMESAFDKLSVSSSEDNQDSCESDNEELYYGNQFSYQKAVGDHKDKQVEINRIYSEEDIELFAKQMFNDNRFLHQLDTNRFN